MQKIFWLSNLEVNEQRVREIERSQRVEISVFYNLGAFGEACQEALDDPDQIIGFVLNSITIDTDLGDLGLPNEGTSAGLETGVAIAEHYLLNVVRHSESAKISEAFNSKPILIIAGTPTTEICYDYLTNYGDVSFELFGGHPEYHVSQFAYDAKLKSKEEVNA